MEYFNRRQNSRFQIEIPLSIRPLGTQECTPRHALASNISVTGLCLTTDLPLSLGSHVEVSLVMPEQVSGMPARDWRCTGRVVRVQPGEHPDEKTTVGVELLHYDLARG
jgi:hypothetical protein